MITSVVAADIVGADTSNLSDPVTLTFRAEDNVTIDASACVYWDFKASGGRGNWSSEGCSLAKVCASYFLIKNQIDGSVFPKKLFLGRWCVGEPYRVELPREQEDDLHWLQSLPFPHH